MQKLPARSAAVAVLAALKGCLIVSCQADAGDPMDHTETIVRMTRSVIQGGATGLRAEGAEHIAAIRGITTLPVIGIAKGRDVRGEVYITPTFAAAQALDQAGADMIALDCTHRRLTQAEPWPTLIARIRSELRRPVLADIATVEDGLAAEGAGADAVATTLYGYTDETREFRSFSWPLLEELVTRLRIPVIAEGHIRQPEEVARAFMAGAHSVVVGSAITRPAAITARFVAATKPG
jgi:putative N-acetylmannosamine-6-phosphate epimerase